MPTLTKLSVPGQPIPKEDSGHKNQHIYYIHKIRNDFSPLDLKIPQKGSDTLMTPIVTAFFDENLPSVLQIFPIVFVNKAQQVADFNLYYNYTLDADGLPQIAIYICYHKEEINATAYEYNTFEIYVYKGAITDANNKEVELSEIQTVQVFLINTDPRTSRGTTTTVQNQTSRSLS